MQQLETQMYNMQNKHCFTLLKNISKKVIFLFMFLVVTFNGCNQNSLAIAKPAKDILEKQDIYVSKITHIDYNSIEKLDISLECIDVSLICSRVDETLEVDYSFIEEKTPAQKGNTVLIDYRILDEHRKKIYCDTDVKIVIGTSCFDSVIEKELTNHKTGDIIRLSSSLITNPIIEKHKNSTIEIDIKGVYSYNKIGSETLCEKHGFTCFEDYYTYLYNMASDELKYENDIKQKSELFKQLIKNCNFVIDDELVSFSLKTVLIHEQQAASFGITLEEYYTNILKMNENDFFKKCTQDSEDEIKKILIVGSLADHYGITVDNEIFNEFCEKNNINYHNNDVLIEAYYSCLEEQVVSFFL